MDGQLEWHDEDQFWELFAPFMFPEERILATPVEVDMVLDLIQPTLGAHILDLGCGPGRHSLELARRGYQVTGIDRTRRFIENAAHTAEVENLGLEFLLADMRQFSRSTYYESVISMFTSFGYFEDPNENQRVLDNVYLSLKPGGTFLIELMGKEILARIFRERDWQEIDGVYHLQERRIAKNWSWLENRWLLISENEKHEYHVDHWVYSGFELAVMLKEAGFETVKLFGGIDGSPFDNEARRLVAVATKGG